MQGDAPIHALGKLRVVRRHERGKACGAHDRAQHGEDALGGRRVEIAGRLVGEQYARRIGDGARDARRAAARRLKAPPADALRAP